MCTFKNTWEPFGANEKARPRNKFFKIDLPQILVVSKAIEVSTIIILKVTIADHELVIKANVRLL